MKQMNAFDKWFTEVNEFVACQLGGLTVADLDDRPNDSWFRDAMADGMTPFQAAREVWEPHHFHQKRAAAAVKEKRAARAGAAKVIGICAKCSDSFSARLFQDGKFTGDYDGYVPGWMPGEHCGDYVELQIDASTGKILNWKKPTLAELAETFGKKP